jgi:hypothetical protein
MQLELQLGNAMSRFVVVHWVGIELAVAHGEL